MIEGIALARQKLDAVGFNMVIDYYPTVKAFSTVSYSNEVNNLGIAVNPYEILGEVKGQYKLACLLFNDSKMSPHPTNPAHHNITINGCTPLQIPLNWWMDVTKEPDEYFPEVLAQFFIHEVAHAIYYFTNQVDKVHDQFKYPEWQQKQPIDYYVHLIEELKPYWSTLQTVQQTKYKYFSQKEIDQWKLKPELFAKLDIIREKCGFPLVITSGLRTKEENDALKDSVSDSSHLSGLAADITVLDSTKRFKLIKVAMENGIKRIGCGSTFVHLDIAEDKPLNVLWHYYK